MSTGWLCPDIKFKDKCQSSKEMQFFTHDARRSTYKGNRKQQGAMVASARDTRQGMASLPEMSNQQLNVGSGEKAGPAATDSVGEGDCGLRATERAGITTGLSKRAAKRKNSSAVEVAHSGGTRGLAYLQVQPTGHGPKPLVNLKMTFKLYVLARAFWPRR